MLKLCFPKEEKKSCILSTSIPINLVATGRPNFLLKIPSPCPKHRYIFQQFFWNENRQYGWKDLH